MSFENNTHFTIYKQSHLKYNLIFQRGIKTKAKRNDLIKADKKIRLSVQQAARNELFLPEQAG